MRNREFGDLLGSPTPLQVGLAYYRCGRAGNRELINDIVRVVDDRQVFPIPLKTACRCDVRIDAKVDESLGVFRKLSELDTAAARRPAIGE